MFGIKTKRESNQRPQSHFIGRLAAAVTLSLAASAASAACEHDGVYYEHGTVLCFGGWLQECTVADYWSAVGMCKAAPIDEQAPELAQLMRSASLLRERLETADPTSREAADPSV